MDIFKDNILGWDRIQLTKTCWLSENGTGWFCRVWNCSNWGQSYGKNKFEAYRLATADYKKFMKDKQGKKFVPVTKEILNSLTVGKVYDFISTYNPTGISGVAYKAENGNTYIKFGNMPVHEDWKIKI